MKYILLMSGTKAGVDTYHAWSQKDVAAHMSVLRGIAKELTDSGERDAGHRRYLPRSERIPAGLLDRGRCDHGAGLRHRRPDFGGDGTRRSTHEYAH
jgi:hypothetical protein